MCKCICGCFGVLHGCLFVNVGAHIAVNVFVYAQTLMWYNADDEVFMNVHVNMCVNVFVHVFVECLGVFVSVCVCV